ncbi:hypothetical protein HPP92_025202 [Vanilla planifolia]|uniref:Uncharacterized protein n=1 Tax=Vanilla planifolia TaxID=51239 RepID=A0A835PJI2_VANPL|nr:hypothetical protein HPP92_025202 [Vanilla planifolia]
MARFLRNGKSLVALLSDGVGESGVHRRGLAAASAATERGMNPEEKAVILKGRKEIAAVASDSPAVAWVPDPATGYYRPANRLHEIDPAELRRILLKN